MLPFVVLTLLVLVAGTLSLTGWLGVLGMVVVSVWWSQVNKPIEGRWLWTISAGHTIVAADLAGLAGLLVALIRAVQLLRS